jgi:hypothetical protein
MEKETSTMTTTIAAPIAQLLRSGALISLSRSADEISELASANTRTAQPDKYRLPLRDFEQARALLDALAWHDTERPVTLDTDAHRRAIQEAKRLATDHEPISPEARDTLRDLDFGDDSNLPVVVPLDPRSNIPMQRKVLVHLLFGGSDFEQYGQQQKHWSSEEVKQALGSPELVDDALVVLVDEGVAVVMGRGEPDEDFAASRCTRHLLALALLEV